MKKLWQFFVRTTFRVLLRVMRFMPWKPALAWAAAMGSIGYHLSARYRRVADKNLRLAYGDEFTERERNAITKRVFQNFAQAALVEFLKSPTMTPDELRARVRVPSFEPPDRLLALGKGLIVISAHFGNFEIMARRSAIEGYRFAVVARQSQDDGMNEITDYIRETGGYEVLPRGKSAKAVLQRLRKGGAVAILPDQKSEDVFVPFFGRLTGTVAGPAVLALKTGAPILPMFSIRRPDGTFDVEFCPEIDITSTGDLEADTHRIMADITAQIERVIRRHPEQWLWLHDRWRAPVPEHLLAPAEDLAPTVGAT